MATLDRYNIPHFVAQSIEGGVSYSTDSFEPIATGALTLLCLLWVLTLTSTQWTMWSTTRRRTRVV